MNKKYIWGIVILVVIIIILGLIVWGVRSSGTERLNLNEPVKIGGLFNLTGYGGFAGEASRDGFIMAIEDADLPEGMIETVIEDGQSDLKAVVSGATKMTEIDKVIAVIGPEWTEFGEVAAPIAVRNKIPFISPWIVAEIPFVKPPYFWSASPSYRSEHAALAAYLAKKGLNRISVVYSKNAWSFADLEMFKEEAAKYSTLTFISEQGLDQTTRDFRTVIAKIKSDKPDEVYVAIAEDDAYGAFLSQARQGGIIVPISTFSSRATSEVIKDRYPQALPGQLFADSAPAERSTEFADKYEKRFGKKVGAPSAAATYDMLTVILNAVRSGARTSPEVISYMQKMSAFEGYSGQIHFDEQGHLPLRKAVVRLVNTDGIAEEVK